MTNQRIIVNGRVLGLRNAAARGYLREIAGHLQPRVLVVAPRVPTQGLRGHLWEQLSLPRLIEPPALLWSPANSGPLRVENQVVTIHDLACLEHPEWFEPLSAAWHGLLLPRLARRSKRVLTVSEFSRHRIVEVLGIPKEKVVAIPCGVDGGRFRPEAVAASPSVRRKYRLPADYVLFAGSVEARTNLRRLMNAWGRIARRYADLVLCIAAGDGHILGKAGMEKMPVRVRQLATVDEDDLPALYAGALAFILPSLYEASGSTLLEAMACGAPVIAARAAALPELAGEAAILVDPLDVDSIEWGLTEVLDDGALREEMRRKGLERIRSFGWRRTAERVWAELTQAAG